MSMALAALVFAPIAGATSSASTSAEQAPARETVAPVDLTTENGASLVGATWRYSDAHLQEVQFRAPDEAGQPTGAAVSTYEIAPQAGIAGFDDSSWPVIAPTSLSARRGNGRASF